MTENVLRDSSPGMFKSNASLSNDAMKSSQDAQVATANAKDVDSHQIAATKHFAAQHAHEDAGNSAQALAHKKMGNFHQARAGEQLRVEQHADEMGRAADAATKKANMADYEKDPNEMRGKKELHADAADAHNKAAQAYDAAGKKSNAKYHTDMGQAHLQCCSDGDEGGGDSQEPSASGDAGSASSASSASGGAAPA